ncbi:MULTISPECIES: aspartyl-phosphate phosphatase Spo0E family protein [Pontibacillus]|uniref:Aspartyl-phosphate phosphatase Spo0E family protein n=1 Tax=Pontibacillus chungwhensis TaxID=265426 RepID=A0ABY8UXS6_9BACI|nr:MULTISPECIES: aspartyl-phosphate phosphatase Spo0E family protein [Pontibacillus]MCD5325766.1 aspartyl-phosphate phosphatase Spo0E family protein [Pontibacillus sp. HN14]WIF98299.1 aspartyl-phosphate phosphatase Spo0E family protein [Pontibacillus chungwhensis]
MLKELLNEIEMCRNEMIQLSSSLPLSSQEVIEASSRLDGLLNEYEARKNK